MKKGGKNFRKQYAISNRKRTICEVLRETFWHTDDPVVRDKLMEATEMAKKMDKRLREYAKDAGQIWDEDMWEAIDDYEERELERMRKCKEDYKK
jgi:hypothetical protein